MSSSATYSAFVDELQKIAEVLSMRKQAYEVFEHYYDKGKLYETYTTNRSDIADSYRKRGLKVHNPDGDYWHAEVELPLDKVSPEFKKELKEELVYRREQIMKSKRGLFGGAPIFGGRKRYKQAKNEIAEIQKLANRKLKKKLSGETTLDPDNFSRQLRDAHKITPRGPHPALY